MEASNAVLHSSVIEISMTIDDLKFYLSQMIFNKSKPLSLQSKPMEATMNQKILRVV